MQDRIGGFIDAQVKAGGLTSDRAAELKQVLASAGAGSGSVSPSRALGDFLKQLQDAMVQGYGAKGIAAASPAPSLILNKSV